MKAAWIPSAVLLAALSIHAFGQHEQHQQPPKPQQPSQPTAQPAPSRQQPQHTMQQKPVEELIQEAPSNIVPPVGRARRLPGTPLIRLQDLEKIALKNNPTLVQAAAEIRGATGRTLQAGLWPNPRVGYTGEEIRGGSLGGGQHGFFVEQNIVLGRKLALGRNAARQEITLAEIEADEQQLRVMNAVRLVYIETLASQELLELHRAFVEIALQTLATAQRLRNIGADDGSEVLQSEIALQQAQLALKRQENQHRRLWRALAAVVGDPSLGMATLEGRIDEGLPSVHTDDLLQALLSNSPAVRIARANVARNEALLLRARREAIPDLQLRAGFQQNRELLDSGRPTGLQGLVEVGIQLPLFNRNQGNVQSARAELERAQNEVRRIELILRERAAATIRALEDARDTVSTYQKEVLPRARQLYEMQLKAWGQMAVSYPVVLQAQNTLFEVQQEYVGALREFQTSAVAMRGFLLTDGLEAPARPAETDFPVREVNVPTTRGGMEQ